MAKPEVGYAMCGSQAVKITEVGGTPVTNEWVHYTYLSDSSYGSSAGRDVWKNFTPMSVTVGEAMEKRFRIERLERRLLYVRKEIRKLRRERDYIKRTVGGD